MIKVGDLVWVVSTQTTFFSPTPHPYAVDPGLLTSLPPPEWPVPTTGDDRCRVLVNSQDRECLIPNVFTSKSEAEKRAKELHDYACSRKGNTYLESGFVYAPYVPLEVTPTLIV